MTLTSKPLAAIIISLLFGGILFSSWMGWWQTETTKTPAKFATGEFAGQANPADIRGSYTFGDIEKAFGVPAVTLAQAFSVQTADPAAYQVKSLEETYVDSPVEIGTSSVRLFVAFYSGLPFDLSTEIYLPEAAADLLRTRSLAPERLAYLEAHLAPQAGAPAPLSQAPAAPAVSTPEPAPAATSPEAGSTERTVKGKTTFQEVLDWGLPQPTLETIIGGPLPAPGTKIKDHCTSRGLDFESIKAALQAEVDKLP